MSHPGTGRTNIADGSATVGIQTETVHGDVYVYQVPMGASPEQRFEVGLRCLSGGMSGRAREHIGEAVMDGYVTSRSCFYFLLALLSGRTLQQVPKEDLAPLAFAQKAVIDCIDDEWTHAIRVINRLLASLQEGDVDYSVIEKQLSELNEDRRNEIVRHLEMFLHGPIQDAIWTRALDKAKQDQCDRQRLQRVWKFFQPEPIGPRVRQPRPPDTTIGIWMLSVSTTALTLAAVGHISVQAWQHSWPAAALALLLVTGGLYGCAREGVEWRFRVVRLRAKDNEQAVKQPVGKGFASRIDREFADYFARYVPRNTDRAAWLTLTASIRQALRDEVVELYRESRIDAKRVAWLIRYLVSDVKDRWQRGQLWEHRNRLRVPASMKARVTFGAMAIGAGAAWMTWGGLNTAPFSVVGAALIAAAAGWVAVDGWLRILLEYKRYAADQEEAERLLENRQAAFDRWRRKLSDKPDDREMAYWLDCDRKVLTEQAMRHYKLKPQNVIAHAFIEAPASPYKRARVRNGPWRYSRYTLLVFLLTVDGVRQMTIELDFEKATFHDRKRINYRYDAVAAVQAAEADDGHKTFELTLVNGHPVTVEVTGPPPNPEAGGGEDARTVAQVTLDTAGLENTLHVLEGIAAEGKKWISHKREREQDKLADLRTTLHGMFD
ncbi:hypothetical protein [Nonomuraea roseoviolacea]|uniref:Uncharacterized protein n=1 Tax=Nonomuraea roseoviolacea subsp. carminata TaxID=160689 RepID=A0ABT1K558_9ACTN|nr:hypothetical protein [Nonomuraea roseoviolacea]MCP2348154.1 hypothetical protein [Nonomuraea roseoviolacea subsp. carminata]